MNLLTILVCLFQGLFEFSDAHCRFSQQNTYCEEVDGKGFLNEFYKNFQEEYMTETNSIKISGGNWTIIDYFPRLPISDKYYTITSLSINDASIRYIDERVFEDLRSLRSLDLSHNQLKTTLFIKYLPPLEKLNLASNKITHVASFTHLSLSHLDMSNNRIRCLDFANFFRLEVLDFSGNRIDSLLDTDRREYVGVSMNLSHNKIADFNETKFSKIYQSLDLSFNDLSVVELAHDKLFLNLSNCNISHFAVKGPGLLHCTELDLSKCQCESKLENFIYPVHGKLKNLIENDVLVANVTRSLRKLSYSSGILDLSHSSIKNIPAYTFSDFRLRLLNLSHMNISELSNFTFQFSDFHSLDLSHSHIKVLQPNVFKRLTSGVMNLSFNEISDVKNIFHEVRVTVIDLSFNALRTIRDHSFANCDTLFVINMSNCLIERIEPLAFIRLEKLRELDLSDNKLLVLERNTFHDLPMLEFVFLEGNKITTIQSRAFSNLPRLRSLNLSSIHLRNLKMNAFVNLSLIGSIDLSNNCLNVIPPQLFMDTPRLETIDFRYNNISTINRFSNRLNITNLSLSINGTLTPNTISNLNVRKFALENSRIETLEADCFQGMYNLEELHFNNSDIRFVRSDTLNGLYNLYYLDSQTLFKHMAHIKEATFRDLRSLKMLNLSGLSIQTIESNSFRGLSNIQEMLLSKNDLHRLNTHTFTGLRTLKVLDLSFNRIAQIDENIFNPLKNLEELYFQHNDMSSIEPNYFKNMNGLRKLRLDHNKIAKLVPDSLSGLQNLQELHLGSNNLTGWAPGVFQHLSNLSVLNISRNDLKTFETGAFSNLVSLTVLDLTETSLIKLDEAGVFFSMRKLNQLFLDGNHLKSFDYKRLMKNLRNIAYIGISYNKWQCKDLSMMIENFNDKNINYEPKISLYDSYNINGVGCIDICDYVYCQHEYVQPNGYQ